MSVDYHSYLLRLWRNHNRAPWRLSLQDPITLKIQTFTGPTALLIYLLALMEMQEQAEIDPLRNLSTAKHLETNAVECESDQS
jgi:hypothetical protein